MDLSFTPDEEKFRAEVRAFLDTAMPADMSRNSFPSGSLIHTPSADSATSGWSRV